MAKTIYEKPVRALLKDMLVDWELRPGQVFTTTRAIQWFADRFPKLKAGSIRAHLVQATINDRNRLHHTATNASDDLLFKVASGQFRLYEPGRDPSPIHEMVEGDVAREESLTDANDRARSDTSDDEGDPLPGSSEFLLERALQNYLAANLECTESGLRLYTDDAISGKEVEAGGRRIDILAIDRHDSLVVIELKISKGYDRVVGQLLRYMNWVRKELADPGQKVRGLIVCRTMSDDLRLACASLVNVELLEYQLSVAVTKVPPLLLPS